jgi:uncharacterized protein DUF2255
VKRIALVVVLALALVAVGTYVAGERTEVAVLRTVDELGGPHDTKLWVVDYDGAPWVRVARPQRQWYQRLLHEPHAQLERGDVEQAVLAHPDESAETRARVDAAFRAKYGAVDWWYGLLLRRGAIPVRLDPIDQPY